MPRVGLEPTSLAALDFESSVVTNFTTRANLKQSKESVNIKTSNMHVAWDTDLLVQTNNPQRAERFISLVINVQA